MIFKTDKLPVVFLSYNEENRHQNYSRLLELCPSTLHLNGIKGIDNAHRTLAGLVENLGTHVMVVDADNYVSESLFTQQLNLIDTVDINNIVLNFAARNYINGNIYNNGGVKVWPIQLLKTIQLESFDSSKFLNLNRYVSEVHIEGSPKQAWRSAFREVINLCTENGKFISDLEKVSWRKYERLWRWMHIGQDIENGIYAIYGARQAAYIALTNQAYNVKDIYDFDFLDSVFESTYPNVKNNIIDECNRLGYEISHKIFDKKITNVYGITESKIYRNTVPSSKFSTESFIKYKYLGEFDVIFLDMGEPYADENFERIKNTIPKIKKIEGITEEKTAYISAAKLATTDYFYIVNANAILVDDFTFDFHIPFNDDVKTRIWYSKKNGLVDTHGGVKLLPRFHTMHMDTSKTTLVDCIGKPYEPVIKISNYTV